MSDVCDKHQIHPTLFYQWQKTFFVKGTAVFEGGRSPSRVVGQQERKLLALENKLTMRARGGSDSDAAGRHLRGGTGGVAVSLASQYSRPRRIFAAIFSAVAWEMPAGTGTLRPSAVVTNPLLIAQSIRPAGGEVKR